MPVFFIIIYRQQKQRELTRPCNQAWRGIKTDSCCTDLVQIQVLGGGKVIVLEMESEERQSTSGWRKTHRAVSARSPSTKAERLHPDYGRSCGPQVPMIQEDLQ